MSGDASQHKDAAPADVATFLAEQIEAWGIYTQAQFVRDVRVHYGDPFIKVNENGNSVVVNGNSVVVKSVYAAYKRVKSDHVLWSPSSASWAVTVLTTMQFPTEPTERLQYLQAKQRELKVRERELEGVVGKAPSQDALYRADAPLSVRQELSRVRHHRPSL